MSDQPKIEISVDADFEKVSQDLQDLMSTFTKVSGVIKPLADSMNKAFSEDTLKVIDSMGESLKGLGESVGVLTGKIKEMHKELGISMPQIEKQAGLASSGVTGVANAAGNAIGAAVNAGGGSSSGGGGGGGGGPRSLLDHYLRNTFGANIAGQLGPMGPGFAAGAGLYGAVKFASVFSNNLIGANIQERANRQYGLMEATHGDATSLMIQKYGEDVPGQGFRRLAAQGSYVGKYAAMAGAAGAVLGLGAPGALVGGAIGAGYGLLTLPFENARLEARQREEKAAYNRMLGTVLPQTKARLNAMSGAEQIFGANFGNAPGRQIAHQMYSDIELATGNSEYSQDLLNRFAGSGAVGGGRSPSIRNLLTQADSERMYGMGGLFRSALNVRGAATSAADRNRILSQMGGFENDFVGRGIVSDSVAGSMNASPLLYQGAESIGNQVGYVGQVLNFGKDQGFTSAAAQSAIASQIPSVNRSIYGNSFVQAKLFSRLRASGVPLSAIGALTGRAMNKGYLDEADLTQVEDKLGVSIKDKKSLLNVGQETMQGLFGNAAEAQFVAEGARMGEAGQAEFGAAFAGAAFGRRRTATANRPGEAPISAQDTGAFALDRAGAAGLNEITKTIVGSAEDFKKIISEAAIETAKELRNSVSAVRRNIDAPKAINGIKR